MDSWFAYQRKYCAEVDDFAGGVMMAALRTNPEQYPARLSHVGSYA
jgi:hypothetical protein